MAKPIHTLLDGMSQERRDRIATRTSEMLVEMELRELRQARELTQQELAKTLDLNQAAVSKVERQSDMYISTLRRYLKAMGAELQIVAHFPDRDVLVTQFEDLGESAV